MNRLNFDRIKIEAGIYEHIKFDNKILDLSNDRIYMYYPEGTSRIIYLIPRTIDYGDQFHVSVDVPSILVQEYLIWLQFDNWKLTWEDVPEGFIL